MLIYNIDYTMDPVKIVSVKGCPTEAGATEAKQGDDVARCIARSANDVASLGQPVLDALAAYKAKKDQTIEATGEAIWAVLNPPKKVRSKPLQSAPADSKSASTDDDVGENKEKIMKTKTSTKKKASKKAAKAKTPKKAGGARGEKTLAVKAMLERKTGVTRAQILEKTGWPSVSVQVLAKNCGLKLRLEKVKGKPITYFGS